MFYFLPRTPAQDEMDVWSASLQSQSGGRCRGFTVEQSIDVRQLSTEGYDHLLVEKQITDTVHTSIEYWRETGGVN